MAEPDQILDKPARSSGGANVDRNMLFDSWGQGTGLRRKQNSWGSWSGADDRLIFPEIIREKVGVRRTEDSLRSLRPLRTGGLWIFLLLMRAGVYFYGRCFLSMFTPALPYFSVYSWRMGEEGWGFCSDFQSAFETLQRTAKRYASGESILRLIHSYSFIFVLEGYSVVVTTSRISKGECNRSMSNKMAKNIKCLWPSSITCATSSTNVGCRLAPPADLEILDRLLVRHHSPPLNFV